MMGRKKKGTGTYGHLDNGRGNRGISDSPKCDNITEDDRAFVDELRDMMEEFN